MKKIILTLSFLIMISALSRAQELGVRFGNISAGNVAVDATLNTAKYHRLHADFSFGQGVGVDLLWDFLYRPLDGDQLKWYAGVGPYAWFTDPLWLGAVGEIGLEYRFNKAPVAIGLDWRPLFSVINTTGFTTTGFGLNIRYIFGRK